MRLAICIPTYNNSEIVEELLIRCGDIYKRKSFDVYIYDSSENEETKVVVNRFQKKYNNLFYTAIKSSVHSNRKVYMIYKKFSEETRYDYIWVCSDSIRWKENIFDRIEKELEKDYDIIVVNHRDAEKIGTREYNDINQLFLACAWHMTLYGATILNVKTILNHVDWKYYIRKYCVPNRINFSHLALYFEQLSKMDRINALYLAINPSDFAASPLKKHSKWYGNTFKVWCSYWPDAIKSLPECYYDENKKAVIKKSSLYSGILDLNNFLLLRKDNIFNISVYMHYRKNWKEITDVNPIGILLISVMPDRWAGYILDQRNDLGKLERAVKKFCKKYPRIYIYGGGYNAAAMAEQLDLLGVEYQGFLVSDISQNRRKLREHSIKEFSEKIFRDPEVGIILGLNKKNTNEVISKINRKWRKRLLSELDM